VKIDVWDGVGYPQALVREWENLLLGSPFQNPFLTPLWNEIWLKHFGRSSEAKLLLFRSPEGTLQAVGPFLNSSREGREKNLELMGGADVCDYRDLTVALGEEEGTFRALGHFFGDGPWEYLELQGISEFSPTRKIFPPLMKSLGFLVTQEVEEISIYLDLPSSWEAFLEELDAKNRHELRRKMRRLQRETSYETSWVEDSSSLSRRLNVFFDLHRKSRKDKAEFMNSKRHAFFQEISARFLERKWLNLSFLKASGKEIAAFLSFDFAGMEFVYNSGYDPEFRRLSPGIVLAALCIRRAIDKGMGRFNFLRGREKYKYQLGGKEEKIYRIRVSKK